MCTIETSTEKSDRLSKSDEDKAKSRRALMRALAAKKDREYKRMQSWIKEGYQAAVFTKYGRKIDDVTIIERESATMFKVKYATSGLTTSVVSREGQEIRLILK
jgi:hypothetical protein